MESLPLVQRASARSLLHTLLPRETVPSQLSNGPEYANATNSSAALVGGDSLRESGGGSGRRSRTPTCRICSQSAAVSHACSVSSQDRGDDSLKSVSKHRFERPRPKVLDVVLGICHQHLLDKIRPARQEHTPLTNAEARKWTIIAGGLEQEIEQPRAELAKVATKQSALWPRR